MVVLGSRYRTLKDTADHIFLTTGEPLDVCWNALQKALQDRALTAIGYPQTNYTHITNPQIIPPAIWRAAKIDHQTGRVLFLQHGEYSEIWHPIGVDFERTERWLMSYSAAEDRTGARANSDAIPQNHIAEVNRGGRPSLQKEIKNAYIALVKEGAIVRPTTFASFYSLVRTRVRSDNRHLKDDSGLSDDTIRRHITHLFTLHNDESRT